MSVLREFQGPARVKNSVPDLPLFYGINLDLESQFFCLPDSLAALP